MPPGCSSIPGKKDIVKHILKLSLTLLFFWTLTAPVVMGGDNTSPPQTSPSPDQTLDHLLIDIEKKYSGNSFAVEFDQESTLKAMEITDTASGKAFFKYPDKMRWEYEKPDRQLIISNGDLLWIYKPEENQVMTGRSPDFFKNGKGASFLTDITSIRKKFTITINRMVLDEFYELKLIPLETNLDLTHVFLMVSKDTHEIKKISTTNSYGDETHITFKKLTFTTQMKDDQFKFDIPPGTDILSLDE